MTEYVKVWRVHGVRRGMEFDIDCGPYGSMDPPYKDWGSGDDAHPDPFGDGIKNFLNCVFGFASEKQLYDWFTEADLVALATKNRDWELFVSTLSVPKKRVRFGGKQVAFPADYAKVLESKLVEPAPDESLSSL